MHSHYLSIPKTDQIAYALGIIGPFMSLPQLYSIWIEHNVIGISILSWTAFGILSIFWCYYGFRHHEKPIIITQALWGIMNFAVVIGILVYR